MKFLIMTNARGNIGLKPVIVVLLVTAGFLGLAYYFSLEFSEVSSQIASLKTELESASQERDLLRQGVKAALDSSQLLETNLDTTDEKLNESLRSALSEEGELIKENREFLERLNKSLTELAVAVQEEKGAHEQRVSEILKQMESYQEQMESSQTRVVELSDDIEDLGQEIDRRFERDREADRETLKSISQGQAELENQVRQVAESLKAEMSLLETEMERLEARMDDLKREIVRLESRGQE